MTTYFADVLLPLPLPNLFTYRIPQDMNGAVCFGVRVVVPFGRNKLYSALVVKVHTEAPKQLSTKYILDIIDDSPVITETQFRFWQWISEYYLCTLGEVMAAALPSALKLAGETNVMLHPAFEGDITSLTPNETKVLEYLSYRQYMTVQELSKVANMPKIMPVIKSLVEKEIVITDEEIKNPYKPKTETFIKLSEPYCKSDDSLNALIDSLSHSKQCEKQVDALLYFIMLRQKSSDKYNFSVKKSDFLKNCSVSALKSLISKNIFTEDTVKVSRLAEYDSQDTAANIELTQIQSGALKKIEEQFDNFPVVLLHGVTGSGKTEIYIKLIDKVLQQGKQVLYLLPEIALTTQIVNRLRRYFGDKVGVYHSRFNEYERVEIWNRVLNFKNDAGSKYQLILGARSALFLPYSDLGLVIVDEEHDTSYKQTSPAPRYHARDAAIVLASLFKARTLLGTATPSIESYHNVRQHRYGLVELNKRFADSKLPEIWLVDMVEATRQKQLNGHLSQFLINHIEEALARNEQVILFQNRRGYSLRLFCNSCQSTPTCAHCDVTLTYHKQTHLLKCHYCGYAIEVPQTCPVCGSDNLEMKGFGTEKIEEALGELFPTASIVRMDLDTTRSKTAHQKIITNFENHKTDILVGTQMVTKGLDFDNVSVVGILNADSLLAYPDFRSFERAYQIMAQVSGRAGRRNVPGKVIVQTYQPKHPALQYVVANDYGAMYENQMLERERFNFPPLCRLVKVTVRHKDENTVNAAAAALKPLLYKAFPKQVLGPEFPIIAKIQNYYLKDFWIKFPKTNDLQLRKKELVRIIGIMHAMPDFKAVNVIINVDC